MPGIVAIPDDSNARYFHVDVAGPKEVGVYIHPFFTAILISKLMIIFFISRYLTHTFSDNYS